MASIVLLPAPKSADDDPGQWSDFRELDVTSIRKGLAPIEYISPQGIASPWAQAYCLEWLLWHLETPEGKGAAAAVRFVVLLQFLGHLAPRVHQFADLGDLGALLAAESPASSDRLIVWVGERLGQPFDQQVIAGSIARLPLFPGAAIYGARNGLLMVLQDRFLQLHGPKSPTPIVDANSRPTSASLIASLTEYLHHLAAMAPDSPWAITLQAWCDELQEPVGGAVVRRPSLAWIQPALPLDLHGTKECRFASFIGWKAEGVWRCDTCGSDWVNESGRQIVSATGTQIVCPSHRAPLRTPDDNRPVSVEDCGAWIDNGRLFVWIDPDARPPGSTHSQVTGVAGSAGCIAYEFHRHVIEIQGTLLSTDFAVISIVAQPGTTIGGHKCVGLPIKGEVASLLRNYKLDELQRRWDIEFHGLHQTISVPLLFAEDNLWSSSTIVMWPPEDIVDWYVDLLAVSTPAALRARFRLIEQDSAGVTHLSTLMQPGAVIRTSKGKLRFIELGREDNGKFAPLGLLPVNRSASQASERPDRCGVVVDFGTSNSACLLSIPGIPAQFIQSGTKPDTLLQTAAFLTHDVTELRQLVDVVAVVSHWHEDNTPQPFLPSLMVEPDKRFPGATRYIPPRTLSLKLLTGPVSRVKSGLKWQDWSSSTVRDQIAAILEDLLLSAAWILRRQGFRNITVRATYPLAFEDARRLQYRNIVREVLTRLRPKTSIVFTEEEPVVLISESAAGSALLFQTTATHDVTLDMGGGTTDIAVAKRVGARDNHITLESIIAADSIELAGRDFLRAIVTVYGPAKLKEILAVRDLKLLPTGIDLPDPGAFAGQDELLALAYVDCLEAVVHERGMDGIDTLINFALDGSERLDPKLVRVDIKLRWEALLYGLLFFLQRTVAASLLSEGKHADQEHIQFNLLGQGWDLSRLLSSTGDSAALVLAPRFRLLGESLRQLGRNASVTVQTMRDMQNPKTAVVEGAERMRSLPSTGTTELGTRRGALFDPESDDVRRTFLGMDLVGADGKVLAGWATPLTKLARRPFLSGDPGYGRLLDELIEFIPEKFVGTDRQFRASLKDRLFSSAVLRHQYADIRLHMIEAGQNDLNTNSWPTTAPGPARSPLAGFLTAVWRPLWTSTKL